MAWKPDPQHKQLAASLLVSNAALQAALKEIYRLKGADGAQWLQGFEQQLLSNPAEVIDGADQEIAELDAAITQMVRAVFDSIGHRGGNARPVPRYIGQWAPTRPCTEATRAGRPTHDAPPPAIFGGVVFAARTDRETRFTASW